MTEVSELGWRDDDLKARADPMRPELKTVQSLLGWRAHQRDCVSMASKLGQLRIVPKPQCEHVAVASDNDCFPPAVFKSFMGDDEVTRRDLVPAPRQT